MIIEFKSNIKSNKIEEIKNELLSFDYSENIDNLKEETSGFVTGYASTYDIDNVNDKVTPQAIKNYIVKVKNGQLSLPKILTQHEHNKDSIGRTIGLKQDDNGLKFIAYLPLNVAESRNIYNKISEGLLDSASIGYIALKHKNTQIQQKTIRMIEEIDIKEISLVTFPANEQAKISVKSDNCENLYYLECKNASSRGDLQDLFKKVFDLTNKPAEELIYNIFNIARKDYISQEEMNKKLSENELELKNKIETLQTQCKSMQEQIEMYEYTSQLKALLKKPSK